MPYKAFPVIDPVATGANILRLRQERGMTVRDLQVYFGFDEPQAIYKWQKGKTLPSVDNLYALGALLEVPMEEILVPARPQSNMLTPEQQEEPCCSHSFLARRSGIRQASEQTSTLFQAIPGSGDPPQRIRPAPLAGLLSLSAAAGLIPGLLYLQ